MLVLLSKGGRKTTKTGKKPVNKSCRGRKTQKRVNKPKENMDGQRWKGFMHIAKNKLENFRRNFSIHSNGNVIRPKIIFLQKGKNVPMGISSLQSGVLSYPRLLKSSSPKKRQKEEITTRSVSLSMITHTT